MADVLLEKVSRLVDMRTLDLWKPSLREPLSLPTLGLGRESRGLRIRIGDLDNPSKHTRLPWHMQFSGAVAHQVIAGAGKSGRTTLLQSLVILGCLQHGPARLAFMLADYGTGKLGEVRRSPNVAAYARPDDEETVARILGEASRLIDVRRAVMVDRDVSSTDAYLESKTADPVAGDPYGYVIVAIDGIGGFLGEKGDDRAERAKLLRPILDRGAAVGVHLVLTADSQTSSNAGNHAHYTIDLKGGVQLPSTEYSGALVPPEVRMTLKERIPIDQPGRSFDPVTMLQARTVIPINRTIEPDREEGGMPVFDDNDYGDEIRQLCGELAEAYAGEEVPPVLPADPVIDYETIWSVFAPFVDPGRHPLRTIIPLGSRMDTLALAPVPDFAQNLIVFGEKGSGKSNVLRSIMESVMRQFTPKDAVIIVIDPLRQQLGERDRLYERGYMQRAKFVDKLDDSGNPVIGNSGEPVRVRKRPPGYVSSREDIKEVVDMLVRLMATRRPNDDTSADDLRNRTYFTGPEVYVFIDNFEAIASGYAAKTPFDEVAVGDETVTRLLATGIDLGVHFIVGDNAGMAERLKSAALLLALRDAMQAPLLQLAAPPSAGSPVAGAFHLRPERWRPGQGRLIVDADDHVMVQTALIAVDDIAAAFDNGGTA